MDGNGSSDRDINKEQNVNSRWDPVEADQNQEASDTNAKKSEINKTVPYYKLFSFADSIDCLLMFVGTITAFGNGVSTPLMTIIFGDVVNAFGNNTNTDQVVDEVSKVSLRFVYLAIGAGIAAYLQVFCWIVTGERQAARMRSLYLKTILRQEIGFFDKESDTGEIVGRISADSILIQDALGEKVGKLLQLVATFIAGFVISFAKGWKLTVVLLSSIPLLAAAGAFMAIVVSKLATKGQTAYSGAATIVEQTIGSIRTVVSFTGEKQAVAEYNKALEKAYNSSVQEGLVVGMGFAAITFVMFCTYAMGVWYGAKMILNEGYNGGTVITIIFAVLTGSMSLGQASPSLTAFAAGRAAAYKMFEVIERKPLIDAYETSGCVLDDIQGDIEIKDVHFSYPARLDDLVFDGFSLTIPSGTTTALVGQSGSGKSTVISLIERFYDPQSGEILIDGINLKEFQVKWIRQKIGLVSQEPVLFAGSIKDNIAYGKDGATIEEIKAAAELANAAKFIDKLPQVGLETMVGEHGTQLSGGQKQRVAIARAMLKDPRILLLDEATSALDAESERIVQEALEKVMINRTTVIVAHRLSTVRNADMIAVIHQGKIFETGSHAELTTDPDGAYSQLLRLQETNMVSRNFGLNDPDRPDITRDSGRYSSQRFSLHRSISRGSSGLGNSSRQSFSISFGMPSRVDVPDLPYTTSSAPSTQDIPFRRLASLNKPELPVLVLGAFAAMGIGATLPTLGLLISGMIKVFFEPEAALRKDSSFWALVFLGLACSCLILYPLRSYLFAVAGCRLIQRMRSMCFEKVVHMEVSWFDSAEHSSGVIGARLAADATSVRSVVGDALAVLIQNIATALIGLIVSFVINWPLALIFTPLAPLLCANGYAQMQFMRGFSADAKKKYEEASQVANDAVGSIRTVASFCAEEKVIQLYEKKCEAPVKSGIKEGCIGGIGFGLAFFLLYAVYATAFYTGARLVKAGEAKFHEVFEVFFVLSLTAVGVSQSTSIAPDASKAKDAVASVFEILDSKSKIDSSDESGETIESLRGEIEFRDISFRYPTRPDVQIFRDLCLSIHSRKTVALVGESGSGKSTVISLLQRFYDPDSGHILLDGIEIQKLKLKWLRQQMGLVSQEPVLFNESIRANIAYGNEGTATEAEIIAAAELANAHKFISTLQKGYDTNVGERGVQLSGGQKQRIAIARAIVKAPKILLLDEATSALDAESERVVQDALDRVMVDRTTVVIAHRLSTIKNADLIAVVKNGAIVEKGKHQALINIKDGVYASLLAIHTNALS